MMSLESSITSLVVGIVVGLGVAAPVGPIAAICILRTAKEGRCIGLSCGLGSATALALFSAIGCIGLTTIMRMYTQMELMLQGIGGVILSIVGMQLMLKEPNDSDVLVSRKSFCGAFVSTFVLEIINPAGIAIFMSIFATIGVSIGDSETMTIAMMSMGTFIGASLWWTGLVVCISFICTSIMMWINRLLGLCIGAYGGWGVYVFLRQVLS